MAKSNKKNKSDKKLLLKRLGYTLLILLIYHLLSYVTIPGVNSKDLAKIANSATFQMLSMFSGGGFQNFSIVSMGVTAYITAQIIVQLLQSNVVPKLTEWGKQGQVGREKLTKVTRALTLVLAFVQSIGVTAGINSLLSSKFVVYNVWGTYLLIGILMTAGTFIAVWLGDLITENGLGNGVSVIICAGIISKIPDTIKGLLFTLKTGKSIDWVMFALIVVVSIVTLVFIVWFNYSERRIPVQYARREVMTGSESFMPLKVNVPGVIPIIFAGSLLSIPQTVLMFYEKQYTKLWYKIVANFFTLNSTTGVIIYGLLIVFFTFLYSGIQIEPDKVADNFSKQEAYIPGVWPGQPTANFMQKVLNSLALPGALFLTIISVVPLLASNVISASISLGISGSSMLIVIGVITEIIKQAKGLLIRKQYTGILKEDYSFD